MEKRKMFYIISAVLIVVSIGSLAIRGLNYGVDFKGGRTYVVRFDEPVKVEDVSQALTAAFDEAPEVKTFGENNQVKITTEFRIDDISDGVDNEVESLLFHALQDGGFIDKSVTQEKYSEDYQLSSQKVGPTISDDIRKDSAIAITFAMILIFFYIFVRFRNWQYGLGAIMSLAHDSIIILGIFSLAYGLLPFSLEIDQAFIAAILTIMGYSINDTVVVFDRIREFMGLYPKRARVVNFDRAINSTLRRTFSTSLSTFVVLFAIFLFGGATIRGFTFALMVGILVGTYSSVFIASPIAYDMQKKLMKAELKAKK